ncbi:MAG: DNA topoisomerase IV subunit A, partial [Candidatus Bathyarchaeia archaeon]
MAQKKAKIIERRNEVINGLHTFGTQIYNQLDQGVFPTMVVRQYILGEKSVSRSARNIRHIKPFTQLAWAAMFSNELTSQRKTSTLRDVYYSAQAYEMTFT